MEQQTMELEKREQEIRAVINEMPPDEAGELVAQALMLVVSVMGQQLGSAIRLYENGQEEAAAQVLIDRIEEISGRKGGGYLV